MDSSSLRVLTFSNLFPNHMQPNHGIFVKNRMQAFCDLTNTKLDVISPIPYFPRIPWQTRWAAFSHIKRSERQDKMLVYHPRYLVIPKIGMRVHGQSMYWAAATLVRRLHYKSQYHLIDAHWVYPDGWAAVRIANKLKLPVILSARGNDINEYIDFPEIRPLITWCLKHCTHIISVCQALKELMIPLGIPESKITVIGNGVDIKKFYPVPRKMARRKLKMPLDKRILLSVGILEPRKGHHILIEALRILKENQAVLPILYIIGSGIWKEHLEQIILKHNLEKNVFLIGEIPNQSLKLWYSAADILCLASDREGWPNVVLESIACGTPVVASSVFGVPEILTSNEVGLLVDERTPEAFAAQILTVLDRNSNPDRLVAFAERHTWDKTAKSLQEVFVKVLGKRFQMSPE